MSEPPVELKTALADHYRLDREVGQGGMATIFLARDVRHDRDVAVKVLHPDLAATIGSERFLAEIKTTARLQHPHILPLLDSGAVGGLLYYVMPFVAGETLRARLEREHLLPIDDALRIGSEVADALDHAHRLGVIHRDVKPENILLLDGHALVADFGIALAVQQAGGSRMTQTGLSLGTPQYMSPEQAMGERAIDARSDQYALGAVIYEMLTGDPPFTGSTVQAVVAKVMTEKPGRIRSQRDRVPAHVEGAVLRALEKLPADRWPSVRDFARALGDASLAAPEAAQPSIRHSRVRSRRAFPLAAAFVAGAAATVATAAVWPGARAGEGDARPIVTSIVPPPGGNFSEQQSLALSPDGRKLAFVFAALDGSHNLWVRDLEKLDATPIAGTAGADIPFWSPDGRSLAYFANGRLQIADPGGDIRQSCPTASPSAGSWSRAGLIVFSDARGISSVAAGGGDCRMIVRNDSGPTIRALLTADGTRIVYSHGRFSDLIVADLDGKTLGTLPIAARMFAIVGPDQIVYPNGDDVLALDVAGVDFRKIAITRAPVRLVNGVRERSGNHTYSFSATGALAFLPSTGDQPYLLYTPNGSFDTIPVPGTWGVTTHSRAASAPGASMIALAGNMVGIWLYDPSTARTTRVPVHDSSMVRPSEGIGASAPVFGPDGSHIAFTMSARASCAIMDHDLVRGTDRAIVRRPLTGMVGCPTAVDWSPDGATLLVRNDTLVELMKLDGTIASRIVRPGSVWEARFSPDGGQIAYASDETGRAEIYVQPLSGGVPSRVSSEGGRWPAWTRDGRRLVFMTPGGEIMEATMNGSSPVGAPRKVLTVSNWRRSTFDDHGVGFAMVGDEERYVVRQSPSGYAVAYVQHWPGLVAR